MVSSDWEAQLAAEGATGSAESQLAFQEEFALAESVAAKAQLVQHRFVPGTPEYLYYGALCELLEVQRLVEGEKHEEAWERLRAVKVQLETTQRQLLAKSCSKRAQRIRDRQLLLELELQTKLNKPKEDIAMTTQRITTSLQVSFSDPEPVGVSTEVSKDSYPTTLSEELLDLDARIQTKLDSLRFSTAKDFALTEVLRNLDVFGREKVFQKVYAWDGPENERWMMLDVFLDTYAFEYTDIPGYVDVIVKDVERKKDVHKGYNFNFRAAHRNLSFLQLLECARQAPDAFRSNSEFATRGMQLLQASAEVDSAHCSDLRRESQNEKELQHIETYQEFLRDFTPSAVYGPRMKTLYRKLELLNTISWTSPRVLVGLLDTLVEYVKIAGGHIMGLNRGSIYDFGSVSQTSHDKILQESLRTLWSSEMDDGVIFKMVSPHLDKAFVDVQYALTMIKLGKGDFSQWTRKLPDEGQELSRQTSSSEVTFCESNPDYFSPEDPLRIYVRTRNVKSLTAHLYEIKTIEYYSRLRREIKGDICLDGLLPMEEQVIDLSGLTPWQEVRIPIDFLAARNTKRGVFVVEVFERGVTCRAILRKGFLRHVERITTRGHEFAVLDESGDLLRDARAFVLNVKSGNSRAQLGREYAADEKGSITVPFRPSNDVSSSDKFAITLCHGSFGTFHGSFSYLPETFDVDIDIHIDSEQLVPGSIAQLVTRPRLLVAGIATGEPLELLIGAKVVIEFHLVNSSNVGSSSHKEVLSFPSMQHVVDHPPSFEIPMDANWFDVTLSACVFRPNRREEAGLADTGGLPKVSDSKQFDVQRVNKFGSTYTAHLVRRSLESGNPYSGSEFRVLVLGHNGEPVSNVRAMITFTHVHYSEHIVVELQSDATGEVKLGGLPNITQLRVQLRAGSSYTDCYIWELPNLRSYRPQIVNCSVEEIVEIPIPFAYSSKVESWITLKLISVCEVVDNVLQHAVHCSELKVVKSKLNCPVGIAVQIRRPGKYVVYLRSLDLKYPVTVCEKKNMQASLPLGLIVQPTKILLATQTLPLVICSQELKTEDSGKMVLEIQLRNALRNSTQVLVVLKHFLDTLSSKVSNVIVGDSLKPTSSSGARLPKLAFSSAARENDFLKMRKISDEYDYILQRRALVSANRNSLTFLGTSSIPKPSLLQNPHVQSETGMEVVNVEAGDKVTGFKSMEAKCITSGGMSKKSVLKTRKRDSNGDGTIPSISFLGQQSQLVTSSIIDENGLVHIDLSGLSFISGEMGSFELCTVAFDWTSGYVSTQEVPMTLPAVENKVVIPRRDIRLSPEEALPAFNHFHEVDSHKTIHPGEVQSLPRSFSSKYALYDSLESAMNLWPNLASGGDVEELANKLRGWWGLSSLEKNKFYYSNASDDLHFFLFRKDPVFFKQYAEPLIAAKVCKSLVDYYVLDDKASVQHYYLGPAAFQRLCCVEKLLVAEMMAAAEDTARICYAVICEVESVYPSGCMSTIAHVFNTVLSQGQVEPTVVPTPAPVPPPTGGPSGLYGGHPGGPRGLSRGGARAPMIGEMSAAAFGASPQSFGVTCAQYAYNAAGPVESYVESDDDFGVRSLDSESDESENADDDDDDDPQEESNTKRKRKQETPYIPPGKVRKVQEKRFFSGQRPALSGCNMYWKEYAAHILRCLDDNGTHRPFVSSYFPEALTSITEGLFALAVLDLDNDPKPSQVQLVSSAATTVSISPAGVAVLYYRNIGPADSSPTANTVLILKQCIRDENGDFNTELLINKVYTTVVTLSNIGSEHLHTVNLLLQIPQGAVPMGSGGFYTKNEIGDVAPNYTSEFVFSFYFPEAGIFPQYPARASIGGAVVAWAKLEDNTTTCTVVRSATRVNLASWADVSARGSLEEVVRFMESAKLGVKTDYQKLLWRCHDESFFRRLVNYLRGKMLFVSGVWKYGLLHRDQQTMTEFFASSSDLFQSVGNGFCSSYLNDARLYRSERFGSMLEQFDHCEFGPFLTRRVHPVTGRVDAQMSWGSRENGKTSGKRILNAEARRYYAALCQRLGTQMQMNEQNLLVMAYYMILLDRIEDGINIFSRLESICTPELENTVQYAYLAAFLDLFPTSSNGEQGRTFSIARRAISRYAAHPQPRWKHRFQKMEEFLEEFDAFRTQSLRRLEHMEVEDSPVETERDVEHHNQDATIRGDQVKLEASVDNGLVTLLSRSLGACELAFYPIDVELMFSTEPFNTFSDSAASASSLLLVEPRQQLLVDLGTVPSDANLSKTTVAIPQELRATQMMIRIREISSSRAVSGVAPPIDMIQPYFNSNLNVNIMTQWGMLQVLHDGMPVRSCYVKVYAKVSSGGRAHTKTEFYKDGYTDLLGKFDYVGVNGDLISNVEKFSILILHDKFGAMVEQADPPVLAATVGDFSSQPEAELLLY